MRLVKGKPAVPLPWPARPSCHISDLPVHKSKISHSQRPLRAFSGVGRVSEHLFSVHSAFLLCESLLCKVGTLDKLTLSGCVFPPQWFFSFVYCRERSWPVCWHTPTVPALGTDQNFCKSEGSLGYIVPNQPRMESE